MVEWKKLDDLLAIEQPMSYEHYCDQLLDLETLIAEGIELNEKIEAIIKEIGD